MKHLDRLLATLLLLTLVLSACQPIQPVAPPALQTADDATEPVGIHLSMVSSPTTLDPSLTVDIFSSMLIEQMFLGLTNVNNETNQIEPELAESWSVSEDGTVWTFNLRQDAQWSDGNPVTAKDIEYGVKRTLMPETASPFAYVLYLIKNAKAINQTVVPTDTYDIDTLGIKALDDYTLQVTLEAPAPYFLSITSLPAMRAQPSWAIEKYGDAWTDPANIVVNGPYKITEWQVGQGLSFVKNPAYFNADDVQIDQVDVALISDPKSELDLYKQGKLDVAGESGSPLPIELLKEVRQDPILSQELHEGSMANTLYTGFTLTKPPFDNSLVRKAFSAAIDREKLAKEVIGTGIPTTQITPKGIFGAPDPEVGLHYDPAQAKQWLADAGYPNGEGFPVVSFYAFEENGGAALQSMWEEVLNVKIEFKPMVFSDLYPTVAPDAPIETMPELWQFGWVADYPDANNFVMDALHCRNSPNFSRASCTEADQLAEQAAIEPDPAKRIALYKQIETMLFEDEVRVAPYHHNGTTILTKPYLQRAYPTFAMVNWDSWRVEK